jgi:hypothetical protein
MRDLCKKARLRDRAMRQKAEILFISGAAPININRVVRNYIFSIQMAIVSK